MTINFPSNPSNGQTHSGFTYNSSVGAWESTASTPVTQATLDGYLQVANVSSTTTVYTALSDLPMSGNDTGAQAYVSGTNRLYLWNGTGWYNIALINTNPTISGASATYNLNTDGSNTVVTLVASDPEGLPITFTASHTGLGVGANAIATVTQSNNIFTFTPTTNTALTGTFTTTFTASDGVNLAGANSSFTLAFSLNNSNYTTALITSVGDNNAVNDSFVDSSPDNRTLTGYGGAHLTTFSPYRQAGYSTYFDGNGDYLKIASSSTFNWYNTAFTIEGWFYATAPAGNEHIWASYIDASNRESLYFSNATTLNWWVNGSTRISATIAANNWYHFAIVDNNGTTTFYLNGVSQGTWTSTYTDGNRLVWLGTYNDAGVTSDSFTGYLSDIRCVKGTAVYTSAFTPPTTRLTAITNTSLLTCHLPYFADGSTSDHTITESSGNTKTEPFTPYEHTIYTDTDDGGSIKLSASGDYVGFSNSTDFDFTGDFTIAAWVYRTGSTGYDSIIAITDSGNDGLCSIGTTRLLLRTAAGGAVVDTSSYTIPTKRWTHVALTRSGSDIKLFLNGKAVVSATSSATISEGNLNIEGRIGSRVNSANIGYLYANIADLYVKNGTADYTADFTPPLTPVSSTGTVLHTKGTGAGIIDKSQSVKSLTLNGDVKSSTTQTKYLSSSMYFDGTGDYITVPKSELISNWNSENFTVEAWVYPTASSGYNVLFSDWGPTPRTFATGILDGNWYFTWTPNGGSTSTLTGSAVTLNQWYHFAVTKSGTTNATVRIYINGTLDATQTGVNLDNSSTNGTAIGSKGNLGDYWDGYVSDLRFSRGLVRYTSNFTPPTAALEG